ncbi:MAG: aldo/keto reductase [Erysipelotrichaceae bacterium]
MKKIELGSSGVTVSPIGIGCMGFGDPSTGMHTWTQSQQACEAVVAAAVAMGIHFFDTASSYQNGTSESYLGQALQSLKLREEVVISTKFLSRKMSNQQGISVQTPIDTMVSQSLKRLQTTWIDLYLWHAWDDADPIEEVLAALQPHLRNGRIKAIGISNCYAWQLERANQIAKAHGWIGFVNVQNHYNLIHREEEREMLPCCKANDVVFTAYSPLAAGRLVSTNSQSLRAQEDVYAKGKYDATQAQDCKVVAVVEAIASQRGVSMVEVALAWLQHRGVIPIVGVNRVKRLADVVASANITLSSDELAALAEHYVPHAMVGMMK